jgi:hypothetical protein
VTCWHTCSCHSPSEAQGGAQKCSKRLSAAVTAFCLVLLPDTNCLWSPSGVQSLNKRCRQYVAPKRQYPSPPCKAEENWCGLRAASPTDIMTTVLLRVAYRMSEMALRAES